MDHYPVKSMFSSAVILGEVIGGWPDWRSAMCCNPVLEHCSKVGPQIASAAAVPTAAVTYFEQLASDKLEI